MKVLHINTYNTGGAAKACLRVHEALLKEGVHSKVLLRNKTLNDVDEVYEIWDNLSYIDKIKNYYNQKKLDKIQKRAIKELPQIKELFSFPNSIWDITSHPLFDWADIIHLHWASGFLDYEEFFKSNSKKIVWTLHDQEPFSGGFHYPPMDDYSAYSTLIRTNLNLKKNAISNNSINIISPSKYMLKSSESSELFGSFSHDLIKNCVDTFEYIDQKEARKTLGLSLDEKIILFVADNLNYPRKGYELLLEATKSILCADIKLYTVGGERKGHVGSIFHLGTIEEEQKMNLLYCAADVLVVPSLIDNLPNTIAEALCSGTPVVGFNTGGIPEMIKANWGLLCDSNSEKLYEAINVALDQKWDRKKISQENRNIYCGPVCAKALIEVYESV